MRSCLFQLLIASLAVVLIGCGEYFVDPTDGLNYKKESDGWYVFTPVTPWYGGWRRTKMPPSLRRDSADFALPPPSYPSYSSAIDPFTGRGFLATTPATVPSVEKKRAGLSKSGIVIGTLKQDYIKRVGLVGSANDLEGMAQAFRKAGITTIPLEPSAAGAANIFEDSSVEAVVNVEGSTVKVRTSDGKLITY